MKSFFKIKPERRDARWLVYFGAYWLGLLGLLAVSWAFLRATGVRLELVAALSLFVMILVSLLVAVKFSLKPFPGHCEFVNSLSRGRLIYEGLRAAVIAFAVAILFRFFSILLVLVFYWAHLLALLIFWVTPYLWVQFILMRDRSRMRKAESTAAE